jgi:hypothetical protein
VVACTGSQISLKSWSPAPGWWIEEKQVASTELEVKFASASGESTIHATCESGVPAADVDRDGD